MINYRLLTLSILLFWSIIATANAQVDKLKAAYLYNFATMTNYPASHQSGNFVIVVVGNSPIIGELDAIAKIKKIGSQSIEVKKVSSVSEISNAHIVFLPEDQKSKLADLLARTSSSPIVVVAETDGASVKGAIFNFVLIDQKLRFEVNESKANAKGIKLAANLVKLGIPVKS
ncbi:MAG TPA: YfiR family protein [Cytophagaceae bacterium]|jgi:hypothetical protein|nr:YfiR family protein [Cytophagaceae bacterium]